LRAGRRRRSLIGRRKDCALASLSHLSCVLAVEDEGLILLDIEQTLRDAGAAEVLLAATADDALRTIESVGLDAAVLDVHLGRGNRCYELAQRLIEKGVPFVFLSGTPDVAEGFHDVPLVMKPFSSEQLLTAIAGVTAARQAGAA
jgi:CheY-like chemotaxis protein